jgi:sulfur-oxidizing protein SoxY
MAAGAVGLWVEHAWARPAVRSLPGDDPARLSPLEREHLPMLRLPAATINGAKVPIVVEMTHPMTADHHITSLAVVNESDPVPDKGTFHLTPANGRAYVAFQARMDGGVSRVTATAECNRHGRWSTSRTIRIPADAGGCTGTAPPPERTGEDIGQPVIRIAELVERGRIERGELIHAQLKMHHPNRTGLVARDGSFEQASEPLHLEDLQVFYGTERVSRFALTPALSDDPFITFGLLAQRDGPLRIVVVNNRHQRFEATHEIRLS